MTDVTPHRPDPERVSALLLGGGTGVRLGGVPKATLDLHGVTLLEMTVGRSEPVAGQVVVGLPPEHAEWGREILGGRHEVVVGGSSRLETLANVLQHADRDLVLVHDVARPFASEELFAAILEAADDHGGSVSFLKSKPRDSLALMEGAWLGPVVDRDRLVSVQTPCAFRRDLLEGAVAQALEEGWNETSVAGMVVRHGGQVRLVPGEAGNRKITYLEDWERLRAEGFGSPASV